MGIFFAHHYRRRLLIYFAGKDYKPDREGSSADRPDHQKAFLKHVRDLGRPRAEFSDYQELCRLVLKEDWPPLLHRKPRNLPFASLGPLFKRREKFLEQLHNSLGKTQDGHAAAVTGKALHGLGGIGKTRLAIEYAWKYADDYSALLFVPSSTPMQLDESLAALAGVLQLEEKDEHDERRKIAAVHKWLDSHAGWLMILDNVDDEKAAAAVEELVAKLKGGHVLITGRTGDFSGSIETFELNVLLDNDAADLLLESTTKRTKAPDDAALAHQLAHDLGGLALALAQAGAYVNKQRMSFARYLALWREKRETVLTWFDKRLVSYNHDVGLAATWATSVAQLTPGGRRLLELLAFLAPEPVPDRLLDVAVPSPANFDASEGLSDLFAYSLATRLVESKEPSFAIHRLVQDFMQRDLIRRGRWTRWVTLSFGKPRERKRLEEALRWVNAAFVGDPSDVRSWPTLDPLAPHALALAERADEAGIPEPTARLMSQLGVLFDVKSRYAEAEPLKRRALAIDEASFGPNHPNVAIHLNNLAQLLQTTNRLGEAEPLMRRAVAITEASLGPDHPRVAIRLNNLAELLRATNRLAEAEPMYRRALAITEASFGPDHPDLAIRFSVLALLLMETNRLVEAEPLFTRALAITEASFGPDHPTVAIRLNNLAQLLKATNRLGEAEPMYRRALAIDEKSFGPDHPNVARDLNNLAELLKATNRLAEAEPLMRRALAVFAQSLGSDHPSTRTVQGNLAALVIAMGRSEAEAIAALKALIRAHGLTQP